MSVQFAVLASGSRGNATLVRVSGGGPGLLIDLGLGVTRVEVVVMPPSTPPARPAPRQPCPPSAQTGRALAAWAAHMPDEALGRALLRLAARSKS